MEHDILNLEFKAEDIKQSDDKETGFIVGYSGIFGNLDSYNDMIVPGAFEEALKENPHWPVLKNHDSWNKIGFNQSGQENSKGLKTVSAIALANPEGKAQYALSKLALEVGGKDAQSIGYIAKEYEIVEDDKKGRIRKLKKIDMWEHSFVTWGANDKAFSTAVKAWKTLNKDFGLDKYVDEFFKFMEGLGHSHLVVKDFMLKDRIEEIKNVALFQDTLSRAVNIFKSK